LSLTIRFTLQPGERPLTEDEIEGYRRSLVDLLDRRLGIKIRG
jgi:phenylalanyl-tRNA synthetase beta subunit